MTEARRQSAQWAGGADIGELARATGATLRALRYYEEKGLIRPHRSRQGKRLFTARQCEIVRLVVHLRRLEVTVADIASLLDESRSEATRLEDLRQALQRRADDLARRLRDVSRALEDPGVMTRAGRLEFQAPGGSPAAGA